MREFSAESLSQVQATARRYGACASGNIGVAFGFTLPVLIGLAGLGIDSASFYNQQSRMQSVADSSALAIAKEMHLYLDKTAAVEASGAIRVEALLGEVGLVDRSHETEVRVDPEAGRAEVEITMIVNSFLPAEVWGENPIVVKANAITYGQERLCVLGLEKKSSDTIKADNGSLVTAPDCAIQSNSTDPNGLIAKNLSTLIGSYICSSGGYDGLPIAFVPLPETDCPALDDPLSMRAPPPVGGCDFLDFKAEKGTATLQPGHYCGGLKIANSAKVTAEPGIYVISGGKFEVANEAQLIGEHVGFYFADDAATLVFKDEAHVELGAPKDGLMAGILFYEDRSAPLGRSFEITSGSVKKLLGTIYLPRGTFKGDGKDMIKTVTNVVGGVTGALGAGGLVGVINEAASYTVIVANRLDLKSVNLVINADYAASDVPVPAGVGPNSSSVRLTH
jgi:Putative Flp pilus-assembly TadE/G-like